MPTALDFTPQSTDETRLLCPTQDWAVGCVAALTRYAEKFDGLSIAELSEGGGLRIAGMATDYKQIVDFYDEITTCPAFVGTRIIRVVQRESGLEYRIDTRCGLDTTASDQAP